MSFDLYSDGFLDLDGHHQMYWQQSGHPEGVPVVILHGGPGAGLNPEHRRYFDPQRYRIIAYDQRGAGKSRPSGELKNNTAFDLVHDLEKLRLHLGVDQWVVTGGSWGSTLTLLYAQTYPKACLALVPRSIFLPNTPEHNWHEKGLPSLFPDAVEGLNGQSVDDLNRQILAGSLQARHVLYKFYTKISRINAKDYDPAFPAPESLAKIEAHFHANNEFLEDYSILQKMSAIQDIPGVILHGRYDMICPVASAFALHKVWPKSELVVVPDAGHSNSEGQFPAELTRVFEDLNV